MKKIIALATIMSITQLSIAQEQSNDLPHRDIKKNEISIDPVSTIALGSLDISYERIISNNTSLSLQFFYKFNKKNGYDSNTNNYDDDDWNFFDDDIFNKEFAVTANYKYFFGNRVARGFYIGGIGRYSSGKNNRYVDVYDESGNYIRNDYVIRDFSDFALGFNVGGKFVAVNGFFVDISFGIARNLFDENSPQIIVKPNVYLGYRF